MNYQSILQVLGEAGCSFYRFMKTFQSALLQEPEREVHHLCNFHTWGLAATQQATQLQRTLCLFFGNSLVEVPGPSCTICTLLREEEDLRIREFIGDADHELVSQWLRSQAVLCMVHGAKLKHSASSIVASTINVIIEKCRRQLVEDLTRLHSEYLPDAEKWGVLGRAAEFLVSQRGLYT